MAIFNIVCITCNYNILNKYERDDWLRFPFFIYTSYNWNQQCIDPSFLFLPNNISYPWLCDVKLKELNLEARRQYAWLSTSTV
jgi:hypothetical protein